MPEGKRQRSLLDLARFCADADQHPGIAQPWTQGGFTYATDMRVLVKVSAREGEMDMEHPLTISAEKMLADHAAPPSARFSRLRLPDGIGERAVPCAECHGSGAVLTKRRKPILCPTCHGEQQTIDMTPVAVGRRWFSAHYVCLLAALPGIRVAANVGSFPKPLPFVFDGGEGLLMPRAHTPAE